MSAGEVWWGVPGFPEYDVSSDGRVRSWKNNRWGRAAAPRVLRPQPGYGGYLLITLRRAGRDAFKIRVHQLVAEAFLGPCPAGQLVRHMDGRPENNWIWNLAYGTQQDNMRDAERHGTAGRGAFNPNSRLTAAQVAEIRAQLAAGKRHRDIADAFRVARPTVTAINAGRNWSQLDGRVQ